MEEAAVHERPDCHRVANRRANHNEKIARFALRQRPLRWRRVRFSEVATPVVHRRVTCRVDWCRIPLPPSDPWISMPDLPPELRELDAAICAQEQLCGQLPDSIVMRRSPPFGRSETKRPCRLMEARKGKGVKALKNGPRCRPSRRMAGGVLMGIAEKIYEVVKDLPDAQAAEVLAFVENVKASSASIAVAKRSVDLALFRRYRGAYDGQGQARRAVRPCRSSLTRTSLSTRPGGMKRRLRYPRRSWPISQQSASR